MTMNLTYDDGPCFCEMRSAVHGAASTVLNSARGVPSLTNGNLATVKSDQLAGFFSNLADTVKNSLARTNLFPITATKALITGGPSAAIQAVKNEGQAAAGDLAAVGKPVGAVVSIFNPLIGGAISAGATFAQADISKAQAQAQAVQSNKGNNPAIAQQYAQVAGQVPGRMFGVDTMRDVINALFDQGAIQPALIDDKGTRKVWANMAADFLDAVGGKCVTSKYACPPGLVALAQQTGGQTSASQLVDLYAQSNPYIKNDLAGGLERQAFVDAADAAIAAVNANAPITYGLNPQTGAPTPAPAATPTTSSVALPAPVPTLTSLPTLPASTGVALPLAIAPAPAPAPTALTQAGIDPNTQAQINAMLASMQAQGANQAQMMNAMMSALAASGANTQAPQLQQAAAQDVASLATPMTAGLSSVNPWLLAGLGGLALIFALARPQSGGARRSKRLTNPRRRVRRPHRR